MVIGSEILSEKQMILIGILVVIFVVFAVLVNLLDNKSLNGIKAKKIGDGQHGTARWATKSEKSRLLSLCHLSLRNGVKAWLFRLFKERWLGAEVRAKRLLRL